MHTWRSEAPSPFRGTEKESSGRQRSQDGGAPALLVAGSLLPRAAADTATSIFQRRCGRPVMEHGHCGWPADHANAHAQAAGDKCERRLVARVTVTVPVARGNAFSSAWQGSGTSWQCIGIKRRPRLSGDQRQGPRFQESRREEPGGEELQWRLRDAQGDPQESPRCSRPAPTPWDETPGELTRLAFPGTAGLCAAGMPSSRGSSRHRAGPSSLRSCLRLSDVSASDHLTIPREGGHSSREKTSTAHRKQNSSMGPWSSGTCRGGIVLRSPSGTPLLEQRSACGHGNIYTESVLSLVEIVNVLAAKTLREPEEKRAQFLREENPLYGRKEFLGREDKDGLRCKRSPRLKTGDLNVQLAKELETPKLLSGVPGLEEKGTVPCWEAHVEGDGAVSTWSCETFTVTLPEGLRYVSGVHRPRAKLTGLNLQTRGTRSLLTPSDP
ncbi:hypothetical protein P7K49_023442 [Saguinus oedipus]|uniref:Uncharacterized protein n=1 Tax=Saguinus oedipus TaxID=9490 RepID=A0ABQ9ULQ3_SAGOE|nr:hypothetical protein P7K49_023442 [Saguinus oedipus]